MIATLARPTCPGAALLAKGESGDRVAGFRDATDQTCKGCVRLLVSGRCLGRDCVYLTRKIWRISSRSFLNSSAVGSSINSVRCATSTAPGKAGEICGAKTNSPVAAMAFCPSGEQIYSTYNLPAFGCAAFLLTPM